MWKSCEEKQNMRLCTCMKVAENLPRRSARRHRHVNFNCGCVTRKAASGKVNFRAFASVAYFGPTNSVSDSPDCVLGDCAYPSVASYSKRVH